MAEQHITEHITCL